MLQTLLTGGYSLTSPRVGAAARFLKRCFFAAFCLGVGGCSSGSSAMLETVSLLYSGGPAAQQPKVKPGYQYLKITIDDRTVYMVLGYVDRRAEGPVEVWYSGTGEVIRLLNGYLVGTTGLHMDWRNVRFSSLPSWQASSGAAGAAAAGTAPTQQQSYAYSRERDLMPGYRFGIRDEVVRTPIAPPQDSALSESAASALQWYEERSVSHPATAALPAARFAVSSRSGNSNSSNNSDAPQVVYSEQCISNDLCMRFERWTPPTPAAGSPPVSAGT